jgi:anion-transporting  ArsA/GET3 family ATPase
MVITASAKAVGRTTAGAVLDRPLMFVSGKGGSGKTTVAAVLGLAAAAGGRRALVCELGGAGRLADAFDRRGQRGEIQIAERLWTLSVDPEEALYDWVRSQPGGAVAAPVLRRSPAFARFVEAAPGAKELLAIGKAIDRVRTDDAGFYDIVVVDGPATGHALGMLAAPGTVGRVAPVGPVGGQARGLHQFLADPRRTAFVGVSLPEEMSLQEVHALDDGLVERFGRGLDLVVVDGVYPDRFTDAEAERLARSAEHAEAPGPLRAALEEHRCARVHRARVQALRDSVRAPVVTLPFVFSAEVGPAEYRRLARAVIDDQPATTRRLT